LVLDCRPKDEYKPTFEYKKYLPENERDNDILDTSKHSWLEATPTRSDFKTMQTPQTLGYGSQYNISHHQTSQIANSQVNELAMMREMLMSTQAEVDKILNTEQKKK